MARVYWKGYLKLSLVTCRVAMIPATSEQDKIRFHTLNKRTGNRVETAYIDSISGKVVGDEDQAKGYPKAEGEYVLLEDEEIAAVGLDSQRTIDIEEFVPMDSIGWIWYDKPHYLIPDDEIGAEAFCVIRDGMAKTRMVGIARLVLQNREHAVMLRPYGGGIVLWTLRYGDEVRSPDDYFKPIPEKPSGKDELKLLTEIIEGHVVPWTPELVSDPMQERLQDLIAAKKGKARRAAKPKAEAEPEGGNVISMMDALRKSIEAEKKR